MSRPLIGVTGPDTAWPVAWWFIRWALRRAGAEPVRLTPRRPRSPRRLDGIVISGGDDIDPRLYLPEPPDTVAMDPERDRFEVEMLEEVIPLQRPILGICRGAQLLNVVLGGSLHGDLRAMRSRTSNRRTPFARKTLCVERGSRLNRILGCTRTRINSLHNQAVDRLGGGLVVSGRDLDDIVQAVEHPTHPFMLGVQWHPEYLPLRAPQRALFQALVDAARQ